MMNKTDLTNVTVAVTLIACAALSGYSPVVAAESDPTVELRWALGAMGTEGEPPAAIHKDTSLNSGTRLKFLLEPISEGSIYLLLLDSQDRIQVLYRSPASETIERAYVPEGNRWFELDEDTGRETFFLLASAEPLEELDRLLTEHDASDSDGKKELSGAIVAEVRRLHKANRKFARTVEKPVMIGGRTRSTTDPESSIDRLAVEISADRFYSKTITIDH